MLKQLKQNQDIVLAVIAVIFSAIIIWIYFWGIGSLLGSFSKAFVIEKNAQNSVQFDIETAKTILRERKLIE